MSPNDDHEKIVILDSYILDHSPTWGNLHRNYLRAKFEHKGIVLIPGQSITMRYDGENTEYIYVGCRRDHINAMFISRMTRSISIWDFDEVTEYLGKFVKWLERNGVFDRHED